MINVTYQNLLHDVALRVSALAGSNVTQINASYDTAVLTAANFKSADWPFNSFRDAILMAMGEFAWAIADTSGHPWRQYLRSQTGLLNTRVPLPVLSDANREIIGVFGTVFDSVDGIPLIEQPVDVVRRIVREAWRTYPLYFYAFSGMRIEHTRGFVRIECCHYSRTVELANFNAGLQIPLPDPAQAGVMARAVSILTKDGAWESQARIYRDYSEEALKAIRLGATQLPALAVAA